MSLDVTLIISHDQSSIDIAVAVLRNYGIYDLANEIEHRYPLKAYNRQGITHNLANMADAANIYKCIWRPEELGITKAQQLIEPLRIGLHTLETEPETMKTHNPPNGWGTYESFVDFVREYLMACEKHPNADISVSR